MRNNLGLLLTKRTFQTPHWDGYVDSRPNGGRLSFQELNQRCNQTANALLAAASRRASGWLCSS